jgi:hypothetical protein
MIIIKVKYLRKNSGYLVTFSNSSDIFYFSKRSQFQRDKNGNKVASIYLYQITLDGICITACFNVMTI